MKKLVLVFSLLFSLFLGACAAEKPEADDQTATATLIVRTADSSDSQEVTFEVGDSVMDVLEDYHKVDETDGFITAIDGVKQDAATNTYWMYQVNGKMAEKGAEELTVAAGDTIEFYLDTFE